MLKRALIFISFLLLPFSVFAGAGRFIIPGTSTADTGDQGGITFSVTVYTDDSHSTPSTNEGVEIRISGANQGDSCGAISGNQTNAQGVFTAKCTATTAEDMSVYIHAGKGDDSNSFIIHFVNPTATNTPAPTIITQAPTATPTLTPTPRPTIDFTASNAPTRSEDTPTPEPSPTPTPAVAGNFFANPTNVIGLFIFLGILGVGGYFLWEAEKWPFNPKTKAKIKNLFEKKDKKSASSPQLDSE